MRHVTAFAIGGVFVPLALHLVAGEATMPWWPDTVSTVIVFGAVAVLIVWKIRADREVNRRLWTALRAICRRFGAR